MCGLAGYLLRQPTAGRADCIEGLLDAIRARGPDDEGVCLIDRTTARVTSCRTPRSLPTAAAHLPHFAAESSGATHDVAFLHSRFAIIDRSAGGHQPFVSRDGTVIAAFQGEIFNYRELRAELVAKGASFHTASDTEVLVEAYRVWGNQAWQRLNGFWAVAMYDRRDATVVLCRDRFGVAPLYYRETADGLYFASLIRPLLALGSKPAGIALETVAEFIETELKDYDTRTCYSDVHSLPAATALRFAPGIPEIACAETREFWTYPTQTWTVDQLSLRNAVDRFRDVFFDAVSLRLRADVPVACELSGGLDSSSVVAAAAATGTPITTYTLRVPESNEEPYARTMLQRYPLDYRVIERPETDFLTDAADFVNIMEEPFHAPNVYTHYKIRAAMKQDGIGVVLCGSAGDEVLAGYESDFWPQARRQLRESGRRWQALLYGARLHTRSWASLRTMLRFEVKRRLYRQAANRPVANGMDGRAGAAARLTRAYASLGFQEQRLYHMRTGLLPYYLRSDDHFTMSLPLEQRSPFLDYRLVEFALQLPAAYLFRNGWTKYVLRRAMEPYLPPAVVWRREKLGFPFPLRRFLQEHRSQLLPHAQHAARVCTPTRPFDYDALLAADRGRLWRLCSTGLWLEHAARVHEGSA